MSISHTPGPWRQIGDGFIRPAGDERTVARVYLFADDADESRFAANCALVTAAPELLEVLEAVWAARQSVVTEGDYQTYLDYRLVERIEAAIARARGQEGPEAP